MHHISSPCHCYSCFDGGKSPGCVGVMMEAVVTVVRWWYVVVETEVEMEVVVIIVC